LFPVANYISFEIPHRTFFFLLRVLSLVLKFFQALPLICPQLIAMVFSKRINYVLPRDTTSLKARMQKTILYFFVFTLAWVIAGCPKPGKVRKKMPRLFTINFVMETGAEPSFMIVEDFNLDGELDLVVTNSGDNTLSYFKGKGDGTFKDQIIM
ncbi:uncharacterized protein METZ01_LOCUS424125, partial [marine metagenome]